MAVYVDECRYPFRGMMMCHMLADSLDELHAMADRLGMRRAWYQPRSTPHYDLDENRRQMAITLGAIPVGRKELVEVIKKLRRGLG